MNCKDIEEKLIDYIDGELSSEESKKIKDHLKNCSNCKNEHEELKSAIDYVVNNSNSINSEKDIKLNTNIKRRKAVKRFTRTGLIAIALSIILVVTVVATDMFGFMEYWQESSERTENAWEKLIENGVGQKLDISTTDKNIKITAEGVISDQLNTIILLKIEDLKGNNKYVPTVKQEDQRYHNNPIILTGDITEDEYLSEGITTRHTTLSSPVQSEDKNSIKLMIWTNPITKDKGDIDIKIKRFEVMADIPYKNSSVGIDGSWDLSIPVEFIKSKTYEVNEKIDLLGNELDIKEIVIAPTATNIKYRIKSFNEQKNYFITNVSFLINIAGKEYERSELSFNPFIEERDPSYLEGEYRLQSLYLEDPSEVELIVNTYNANSKLAKTFTIDWDNLPQTIDFKGSKITVESLEIDNKRARIIINEDVSKDREYIKSDISLKITHEMKELIEKGNKLGTVQNYYRGRPFDSQLRDSNGKAVKEKLFFLPEEYYTFVSKQEILIDQEDFEWNNIEVGDDKAYLRDSIFTIEGLNYKEFPNSKINIKLK